MRMRGIVAGALLLALAAAACRGEEPKPEATPEEKPVRGGTLVVGLTTDPAHLNPAITTAGEIHSAAEILYNGLLALDEKGEPEPDLAAALPRVEQGGTVYRFTLRDDVKWHDGTPFTSDDVKFSFDEVLLKFHGRSSAALKPVLEAIEAPDPKTVVFRFKQPYGAFLQQLDVTEAPIVPKHVFQSSDPQTNAANTQPVGTGAFKFVSFTKGSEIRYARNPDYFKKDLPYLDEIVMRIIPEPSAQALALEKNEVDWIAPSAGPELQAIESNPDFEVVETNWNPGGANCIMTISFNLDRPIFKELEFRQAFASALNRQQFVDQILFGKGKEASAPISSGIPWAHAKDAETPGFDKAKAVGLLDEIGWKKEGDGPRISRGVPEVPDGTPLRFNFLHFPTFNKYGELVRQQLGDVGMEVEAIPLDPGGFRPRVFVADDFDTNIISYCNATDPQIGVRRMYHSDQIGQVFFSNASHYSNPQVDSLFDKAAGEVDLDTRGKLYQDAQEILVKDLPYVWVVETTGVRAHTSACRGFTYHNGLFAEAAYCKR